jgi:hypothetical protein
MSESKNGLNESIEQSRVETVYVERLFNLGNYENIKYGLRVAVAPGDDPGRILVSLENIFNDLHAKHGVSDWFLERAKAALAKPEAEIDELEKDKLDDYRASVAKVEETKERRRKAREALATLNYTSEHKDHKEDWEDDGFEVEF